jgi:hypothetical protein
MMEAGLALNYSAASGSRCSRPSGLFAVFSFSA